MNRIGKMAIVASTLLAALGATAASADTVSNPTNNYSFPYLSGSLTGGNQTQYVGESFTAPITGELTNFQFTLNTSSLQSVYGVVYGWNGSAPTTELWRSETLAGTAGLFDFSPTGVTLTQGESYVAFLSTFGLTDNSGLATMGSCLAYGTCGSTGIANLGTLVYGNVFGSDVVFNPVVNSSQDATFSVTVSAAAVPEPATWAMFIGGFGLVGSAMRRRQKITTRVGYAA